MNLSFPSLNILCFVFLMWKKLGCKKKEEFGWEIVPKKKSVQIQHSTKNVCIEPFVQTTHKFKQHAQVRTKPTITRPDHQHPYSKWKIWFSCGCEDKSFCWTPKTCWSLEQWVLLVSMRLGWNRLSFSCEWDEKKLKNKDSSWRTVTPKWTFEHETGWDFWASPIAPLRPKCSWKFVLINFWESLLFFFPKKNKKWFKLVLTRSWRNKMCFCHPSQNLFVHKSRESRFSRLCGKRETWFGLWCLWDGTFPLPFNKIQLNFKSKNEWMNNKSDCFHR